MGKSNQRISTVGQEDACHGGCQGRSLTTRGEIATPCALKPETQTTRAGNVNYRQNGVGGEDRTISSVVYGNRGGYLAGAGFGFDSGVVRASRWEGEGGFLLLLRRELPNQTAVGSYSQKHHFLLVPLAGKNPTNTEKTFTGFSKFKSGWPPKCRPRERKSPH